ncbi:Conserved oligomeric Golgi complex subunit 6 [Exophiala dermatitidis]
MATGSHYFSGLDGPLSTGPDVPTAPGSEGSGPGPLSASRRSNALTTKLAGVLSSSFADHETRDALRVLDGRGIQSDEDTRRNLKAAAQKEVISCNAKIVDDFGQVAEQLKRVGAMIATLNQICASMRQHIVAAKQETGPMLEEASTLLTRKQETETKQQLLNAFNAHFLVSPADLDILTSSAEPVDERFFAVLDRVKQIHRDCEVLLGYDTENQRLGLDLMEQTARHLDAGFKKLYTWIQREFRALDLEDPHISASIRRALRVLSERPTLFQNCLDFFAEARQSTLAESFHAALTGGALPGAGKAIEFSTHEPLRYIGDMLAWVHSAAVSEKEALEGLFVSDADEIAKGLSSAAQASEPWARIRGRRVSSSSSISSSSSPTSTEEPNQKEPKEPVFDGRKALSELISRNLASVCETLQSRIDIAVRTNTDPVLAFKIFNLLDFYRDIFGKLVGSDSSLAKTMQSLQTSTLAHFEAMMEEETAAATATAAEDSSASTDPSPPAFLTTALSQFSEVVRARGPQLTERELERLFAAMLGGILNVCAEAAVQIPDVRRSTIYKINYMGLVRSTLASLAGQAPVVQIPLEKSVAEIHSLRDQLVEYLAATFLENSGVRDLMQELDTRRGTSPEGARSWLVENLDEAAQRLDEFLSSAFMDAQDCLKNVVDRTIAKDIIDEAVERFCADFDELEGLLGVMSAENIRPEGEQASQNDQMEEQAPSIRGLYPRTGAEVRALLS